MQLQFFVPGACFFIWPSFISSLSELLDFILVKLGPFFVAKKEPIDFLASPCKK